MRNVLGYLNFAFLFLNSVGHAAVIGQIDVPGKSEYRCQAPMHLFDFQTHLKHGTGHRSILWNITSLDPNAEMRLGFIQLSIGAVSPGASLVLRGQNGGFEIPAQALTLERNWLETLRGTDVMEELPPEQQLVLWINEVYHLFVVHTLDLSSIPTDDPFWRALHAGVFIFSGKNLAFIVGKDHRYLTVCPRVVEGKVELNTKQIAAEIVRFMRDERVKQFFSCEALLGSNKI